MATIGDLWINVKANTRSLAKGLGKSRGMLGKFGKFAASPAGLAVVAFAALTLGVMATVRAVSAAVRAFAEFEAGMSEVKSILLGVKPDEIEALTDQAKLLGATTKFTGAEAASGMAMLARAGFTASVAIGETTSEIENAIKPVLDLAAATGMDMATAANIAAVAVRGFGLDAKDAAHVADVLAVAASSTNTTVEEMGDGFSYVAPIAAQLGFSIEETAAMMGKLADAGIKGSKGGTALRTIMIKMGKAIEKDGTGALKDYLKENHTFLENFDKFGKLGVTAIGVLQGVVEETDDLTETMIDANGVVGEMADMRLDNLSGDVTLFQSAVNGLQIELGDKMAPTLRAIVQVATKFIGGMQAAFGTLFDGSSESIISIETLMTVFKVIGGIIIGVITILGKFYNRFAFIVNTIKALVLGLVTVMVVQITTVVKAVAWGLDAIGVISTDTYDAIVNTSDALVEDLGKSAIDAAKDAGANFVDGWGGGAERAGEVAFDAFSNSMDGIKDHGKDAGKQVAEKIAEGLSDGAPIIKATISEVAMELIDAGRALGASLQKQVETFGMSKAEAIAYSLSLEDVTSETVANAIALEKQLEVLKKTEENKKLISSLEEQIAVFGMSRVEAIEYKLALEGIAPATIENVVALEKELDAMKEAKKASEDAIAVAKSKADAMKSAADRIIESLRTPQEVFDDDVARLQEMVDNKLLSLEQFTQEVDRLRKDTEKQIEIEIKKKVETEVSTKGLVEGLSSALGSIKIAGQVNKAEQIAEKSFDIQKKIETVMSAVSTHTKDNLKLVGDLQGETQAVVDTLQGTLTTDVDGLESMIDTVDTSINNIANSSQMDETEQLLGTSNDLSSNQLTELQNINNSILAMSSGGSLT